MSNDMTRRTEFFRVLSTAIGEEASTMVLDHLPPPGWTDHIERRFDAVDPLSEQLATHMQTTVQQFSDISAHMRQENISVRMALMAFSLTVALSVASIVIALVT